MSIIETYVGSAKQKIPVYSAGQTANLDITIDNHIIYDEADKELCSWREMGFRHHYDGIHAIGITEMLTDKKNGEPTKLIISNKFLGKMPEDRETEDYIDLIKKLDSSIEYNKIIIENPEEIIDITPRPFKINKGDLTDTRQTQRWDVTFKEGSIYKFLEKLENDEIITLFVNLYDSKINKKIENARDEFQSTKIDTKKAFDEKRKALESIENLKDLSISYLLKELPNDAERFLTEENRDMIETSKLYATMIQKNEERIKDCEQKGEDFKLGSNYKMLYQQWQKITK